MAKTVAKNPRRSNGGRTEQEQRAELLAWFENYKPRTKLGRKLVERRITTPDVVDEQLFCEYGRGRTFVSDKAVR